MVREYNAMHLAQDQLPKFEEDFCFESIAGKDMEELQNSVAETITLFLQNDGAF